MSQRGNEAIWIIVDRLTKSDHFIPMISNRTPSISNMDYIKEVVRLHGIPVSIVSDRDPLFTGEFWRNLQSALETTLNLSIACHSRNVGQTKRMNRIMENLLRACIMDSKGHWEQHLHLVEFTYNNSYQTTMGMTPFETSYGRPCKSPNCWKSIDKILLETDLIRETTEKIEIIRQRMKTARDLQKSYVDWWSKVGILSWWHGIY